MQVTPPSCPLAATCYSCALQGGSHAACPHPQKDADAYGAAGVMHLLSGVRTEAQRRWNESHPGTELALVGLELDLVPRGAALMAASTPGGALQRLRARRLGGGAIELLPRNALSAGDSRALALASERAAGPYAWPLRSAPPAAVAEYERLLREVLASRLFRPAGGIRLAPELQLRLQQTEAEAVTLVQIDLQLERQREWDSSRGRSKASERSEAAEAEQEEPLRGVMEVLAQPREGPFETWTATMRVEGAGDGDGGGLRFRPVHMQLAEDGATRETVSFGGQDALLGALLGNATLQRLGTAGMEVEL